MTASYLGSVSVGGALPPLSASFGVVGTALQSASGALALQADAVAEANAVLSAQLSALAEAKAAIRALAIADLDVSVAAAAAISANLTASLSDPTGYLDGLIAGNLQVGTSLGLQIPTVTLNDQITATASVGVSAEAKIAAIDAALDALVTISAAIAAQVAVLDSASAALGVAYSATLPGVSAFVSMSGTLGTAGAQAFLYTGALGGLGAALDAITPSAGVSASVPVKVPLIFVQLSDAPAVAAVDGVYKVS